MDVTQSEEAKELYRVIDDAFEELNEGYDRFYEEGVRKGCSEARKALMKMIKAAKQLRKVLQVDKAGEKKPKKKKKKLVVKKKGKAGKKVVKKKKLVIKKKKAKK